VQHPAAAAHATLPPGRTPETRRTDTLILMGVVGKPHGVRGLVHVHSYAAEPEALAKYVLLDEAGRQWKLVWRSEGVAELRDPAGRPVASRTDAEKLVNTRLLVERSRLPPPGDDEFYLADLVGLEARTEDGTAIGRIAAVHDYGGGTSLEICRPDAGSLLVPFTRAAFPYIDVQAGHLTVVPPQEIELRELAA
jgi:16S rRNA processing protein RimM